MAFMKDVNTQDVVEAMNMADHNYTVEMCPLHLPDGTKVYDKKAVVRADTGKYLGTVGKDYKPVQPVAIYEMAQTLISSTDGHINGLVNMHGGSVFGISLHLAKREYVAGDVVDQNFLILAAHNGMYGILGRAITNRWFCTNQLPSSTKLFNLKHTRFVESRLDTAMKMLAYYNREMDRFDQNMKALVNLRLNDTQMVEWFRGLFPVPKTDSKRSNSILENNTATFINLLEGGRGVDQLNGGRGTGWHALNALTEYVNHERTTRVKSDRDADEVRFESINFGAGNDLMQKGVSGLLEIAKTEPSAPIRVI
jgi:phage/plasmid-like protein (TIGR03299 family)